jgi:undecaprenyl-diphosphatase
MRLSSESPIRNWILFGIALLLAMLLLNVASIHHLIARWDIALLYTIQSHRIQSLDKYLSFLTDITTYVTVAVLLTIFILAAIRRSLRHARQGLTLLSAFLLSAILSNVIKVLIGRQRPFVTYSYIEQLSTGGSPSFPSGHTTEAFTVATMLLLLFPDKRIVLLAFLWAIMVAYTRMALGVHYPGDVLGAALLGSAVSFAVKGVWDYFRSRQTL